MVAPVAQRVQVFAVSQSMAIHQNKRETEHRQDQNLTSKKKGEADRRQKTSGKRRFRVIGKKGRERHSSAIFFAGEAYRATQENPEEQAAKRALQIPTR